jgi:hypothetical protein
MDSKTVNKEIRSVVWAALKDQGFTKRTSRTAWRHWHDSVDVINFQSFNAYNAGVLGCTTYSFAVNLGVWLRYIPSHVVKERNGQLAPEEYECHLRRRLKKRLVQHGFDHHDIWLVTEDGSNVGDVVADAAAVIRDEGVVWFDRFRDPEEVLQTLTAEDEAVDETWGFGRKGSPVRNYMTGYAAVHVGRYDVAVEAFEALLESGVMEEVHKRVRDALAVLRTSA